MRFVTMLKFVLPVLMLALHSLREAGASTLITDGPWILNSTNNERVHLKCANWYGAHQELWVVGGLEVRSVSNLTDLFKSSGANCVRLPYSVELVKYNPFVRRSGWLGSCRPITAIPPRERWM